MYHLNKTLQAYRFNLEQTITIMIQIMLTYIIYTLTRIQKNIPFPMIIIKLMKIPQPLYKFNIFFKLIAKQKNDDSYIYLKN